MATECEVCQQLDLEVTLNHSLCCLPDDCMIEDCLKQNPAKVAFLKCVNAFMNTEGGGTVIIHTHRPHLIEPFDKLVDESLRNLIADGRQFSECFERSILDRRHIMIRVKARLPHTPISTLNLAMMKTSLDSEILDFSQGELLQLVAKASKDLDPDASLPQHDPEIDRFRKDEEVKVKRGVFQESAHIQAKGMDKRQTDTLPFPSFDDFWDDKKVRDFISAFCSVPQGGSHFSGIQEMDEENQPTDSTTTKEQGNKSAMHTGPKGGKKEKKKKTKTGTKFVAKGYKINRQNTQNTFLHKLQTRIKTNMMWLGRNPPPTNPVSLIIYPVEGHSGGEDVCIVEVKVKYFHGLCFKYEHGPKAHYFPFKQPKPLLASKPSTCTLEQWVWGTGGNGLTEQDPEFNEDAFVDHCTNANGGTGRSEESMELE